MIHLVSTWSEEYAPLARLTWFNNKLPYAIANSYTAHLMEHPGDPVKIKWDRLAFLRDRMAESAEGDWFFFSGTDAFISRLDYKVEQFIRDDADFICSLDFRIVFGDWLLIRNCPATRKLLTDCIKIIGWSCDNEQLGFSMLLSGSKTPQEWLSKAQGPCDTLDFYNRLEGLLSATDVRVKLHHPFQKIKVAGDLAWIHDGYRGIVPKFLEWDEDTFMLHMGGKPLHFRLGLIPLLMEKLNSAQSL